MAASGREGCHAAHNNDGFTGRGHHSHGPPKMGFALGIAGDRLLASDASPIKPVTAVQSHLTWPCDGRTGFTAPSRLTSAWRLQTLRPFLKYRSQFDPGTAIVPRGFFGSTHRRPVPHIYTEQEIDLLRAVDDLAPTNGLRPATYRLCSGCSASTGLRISEALHLRPQDVNLARGFLTVSETKFRKSRLVPLHPTTVAALKLYADFQQHKLGGHGTEVFFVSDRGKRLPYPTVCNTFVKLRQRLAWIGRGGYALPRIHDIRHTFITRCLLDSYHRDQLPDHVIDTLSTYVGHAMSRIPTGT